MVCFTTFTLTPSAISTSTMPSSCTFDTLATMPPAVTSAQALVYWVLAEQAQGLPDLDHRADVWAVVAICCPLIWTLA